MGCGTDGAQFCLLLPCLHRWEWDHWRAGMGLVGYVAQSNTGLHTWPPGGADKLHKHPYFKPHFPELPILDITPCLLQVVWQIEPLPRFFRAFSFLFAALGCQAYLVSPIRVVTGVSSGFCYACSLRLISSCLSPFFSDCFFSLHEDCNCWYQ